MDIQFNIFISHDSQDEAIAIELKSFLEDIFLNANVYVSGRDLEGGQTWIENIKLSLKTSQVIISIISRKSIDNNWIYFETGSGFVDDKAIPLICDQLQFSDLHPPLSLLQARTLSKQGIEALVQDIANKLSLRKPKNLSSIDKLLTESDKFLKLRTEEESQKVVAKKVEIKKLENETVDSDDEVLSYFKQTNIRLKSLLMKKVLSYSETKDIPTKEELKGFSRSELVECMRALNIKYPNRAVLNLIMVNMSMPKKEDKRWKKINALKNIEDANNMLDKFEKEI